ncbi:MAG: urea ABC transporter ATP-binding protein UrtD [Rhizobiales bacterium]|nr:urea ABC transporter ATP-binding protein UrtD [Hyphomicrobiales bacterium]MBA69240.1 urea ABC transporter ATP-binding protein UrtD [Hyphomicrobiales bacterium]|tara:strand:+ start:2130 stop:2870 length:741 start_codon:yes stop_codon:yes gene_type:complete
MSALLEVLGVSVTFDGFRAINDLSFSIQPAELRAIIGPNGAGKTTFMDIVTGKTRPDSGRVQFGTPPVDLLRLRESDIARIGIGRKFQRPTVFEAQTVFDNLSMALRNERSPFSALGYKAGKSDIERIEEIASEIGLADHLKRLSGELSHGQKQWLEIGMLLAQDPQLLLVDEPAAGMTLGEREHTTDLLVRTARTRAVIVVEHDMEFVRRLECPVTVLHEGSVLAEGSLDHVTANPEVIEVYLGR